MKGGWGLVLHMEAKFTAQLCEFPGSPFRAIPGSNDLSHRDIPGVFFQAGDGPEQGRHGAIHWLVSGGVAFVGVSQAPFHANTNNSSFCRHSPERADRQGDLMLAKRDCLLSGVEYDSTNKISSQDG